MARRIEPVATPRTDPAELLRRSLRVAALLAWAVSWFLPAWKPGQDPFVPGWGAFLVSILSPAMLHFFAAAVGTLVLPAYTLGHLRGRSSRTGALLALACCLLAAGCGAHVIAVSDIGAARLGPGYWSWLASFVLTACAAMPWAGAHGPDGRTSRA